MKMAEDIRFRVEKNFFFFFSVRSEVIFIRIFHAMNMIIFSTRKKIPCSINNVWCDHQKIQRSNTLKFIQCRLTRAKQSTFGALRKSMNSNF